jgi:hypothetical protein
LLSGCGWQGWERRDQTESREQKQPLPPLTCPCRWKASGDQLAQMVAIRGGGFKPARRAWRAFRMSILRRSFQDDGEPSADSPIRIRNADAEGWMNIDRISTAYARISFLLWSIISFSSWCNSNSGKIREIRVFPVCLIGEHQCSSVVKFLWLRLLLRVPFARPFPLAARTL